VTVVAPLEFVSLNALWPFALAFLIVLGLILVLQRRSR
jgi:hypothetical protein